MLRDHEKTSLHKAWVSYKASKVHGDVAEQLQSVAEVSERREFLCHIVLITAFLDKWGISFCGHSEGELKKKKEHFFSRMHLYVPC